MGAIKLVSKLYFQSAQFLVTGTVSDIRGPRNGKLYLDYELEFSADLVEILDDYFYRESLT